MINVFNIERFAIHDGDGIRTVVFLKGCPLHCPWCANPESWDPNPQLLYDKKKCIKCRECEKHCKSGAIYFIDNEFHYDKSKGDLCKESVENCPTGSLSIAGEPMSVEEIVYVVMKDIDYYENSNGGVTISGGEPFTQYEGLLALLKAFKDKGLNTAVETTGHCDPEQFKTVEPYVDTFLFDIKHLNSPLLKKTTGIDKDRVMANFQYIANTCPKKIVIRVPVIPGFNYDDTFLNEVIMLGKENKVREINLLPYHTLGKSKWDQVMKKYYSDQKMLDKKALEKYKTIGQEMGVYVKIGG